jgi:hypothetical protein
MLRDMFSVNGSRHLVTALAEASSVNEPVYVRCAGRHHPLPQERDLSQPVLNLGLCKTVAATM